MQTGVLVPDNIVRIVACLQRFKKCRRPHPSTARGCRGTLVVFVVYALIGSGISAGASLPAMAHEFTVAIVGSGATASARVAEVARGVIVAADEQDGHAGETSDGHLGGLDVQITLVPDAEIPVEMVGTPKTPADIAFILDQEFPREPNIVEVLALDTIVVRPGVLPAREYRAASDFDRRFRMLFGRAPTQLAEQGYNVALRIDLAIRSRDGFEHRPAIEASLAKSAAGIDW